MSKKALNDKQKKALHQLHIGEIILEISFVVLLLTLMIAGVGADYPMLGISLLLIMLVASILLFGSGIYLTGAIISMRHFGKSSVLRRSKMIVFWLITTWVAAVASVISFLVGASSAPNEGTLAIIVISVILLAIATLAGIALIISTHLLWRQFNKNKKHNRLIAYGALAGVLMIMALAGKYTITEDIAYSTTYITDANLELGQSEIRQSGNNGKKIITKSVLFGVNLSEDNIEPKEEQIARGSKRFQYMYCSDGSYYYYTAEQFKDSNVGYTHQSPDQCAKNGKGTQTALADTPPPERIVQQVPVYQRPTYSSPTYTTCTESYFGNSFTCRSY